jgi:Flp pilus assembly protein TadG
MVRLQRLMRLPQRSWFRVRPLTGQGLVEFGIAGTVFFMLVFGTLDIGRAVFQYSEVENAVREGARVAKVKPCDTSAIQTAVLDHATGLGIAAGNIGISGGCTPPGTKTVSAPFVFTPILGGLLGISPISTTVSTTVEIE